MNWCSDRPPTHVGVCRNLKSIVVQIGIEDYFEDPNSPEARKLFDEMVNKLQVSGNWSQNINKRPQLHIRKRFLHVYKLSP